MEYDVFICHASDDKDAFVRPLATELSRCGLRVWFDEFALKPGDSLRESIDRGLRESRRCVVVLSPRFFGRAWTEWELNGIVQRHLASENSILLPIWLDVSSRDVRSASPSLADLVAVRADVGIQEVAHRVAAVIGPSRLRKVFDAHHLAARALEIILSAAESRMPGSLRATLRIRVDQDLVAIAVSGLDSPGYFRRLPIGNSVAGLAFRTDELIIAKDIQGDLSNVGVFQPSFPETRSLLAVPLRTYAGEGYGVVSVSSSVPNAFAEGEEVERLLKTIAICGLAVEPLLPALRVSSSA